MKPANLKSKIFLDGGDPNETKEAIKLLGFLDGQTTNPTLIAKNPEAAARLHRGEKFTEEEILEFYKKVVQDISELIPNGSISVEVYADKNTSSSQMLKLAKDMSNWIPNAHIKFPITLAGLEATEQAVKAGIRVNMTLCFSEEQAAAVYSATIGTDNTFVSPFVGRLDDQGENGMDLIKNIMQMYKNSDHHVKVVTASVRNLNHFLCALALKSDIITAPLEILKEWAQNGFQIPGKDFICPPNNLKNIPYQEINLNQDWHKFNIAHDLTDIGIEKFSQSFQGKHGALNPGRSKLNS